MISSKKYPVLGTSHDESILKKIPCGLPDDASKTNGYIAINLAAKNPVIKHHNFQSKHPALISYHRRSITINRTFD